MEQRNYEEESATLNTKLFDLTEAPIKEWLANLLNAEFTDVFSDYVDNSDIIGFQTAPLAVDNMPDASTTLTVL
jgi:hypothetical protein